MATIGKEDMKYKTIKYGSCVLITPNENELLKLATVLYQINSETKYNTANNVVQLKEVYRICPNPFLE